ncbi:MAG: DUF3048 domain-containing protein [Anaerolineae bacterium]|nr:DUF3048 domain-containing protein [Anaerolineae bacterium]MCB0246465.1 DUF3048 domain-containing protein [Anaerolineae bacterium]MCB0248895.1 DUF3048 domain-containing protein [Anaerolineae bacterium]MCB9132923.1 DUF3048 domain-containing protein [Anaerolineales bacterium]MCB9142420.1 DUF3048 domain-containing protein [Anaerolineales bacterium]
MSARRPAVNLLPAKLLAISLITMFALAACNRNEVSQATPTSPPVPVTATAQPTDTPTPAPTATPEPTPSPTFDFMTLLATNAVPEGISPFTGLPVADQAVLDRMPAAIKISNSPIARPQSGLSKADVVIEHLAEGGITRFTAIYHSQDAERIGSVRSARLIDLEIPVLFDSYLVYSGASGDVERMIEDSDFASFTLSDEHKDPGFYRLDVPGRTYEHSLFTDSDILARTAEQQGWTGPPRSMGWAWSDSPPDDAAAADSVEIPYSSEYSDVRWEYDPETGTYGRWILGEPHMDDLTGEQLTAPNVVVLYVSHVPTLIVEDVLGSQSVQIQLWDQGRMQLFRDGVVQEGTWMRPRREDPLVFLDEDMNALKLKPGPVWIEIVPLDMPVTVGE